MWDEFNIKTWPAETIVYRDGKYCPDLSTLPESPINSYYEKPIHVIYIGKITGKNRLDIELNSENQNLFLDVRIKNEKPAFFNIFIKNTGKNSEIRGHVLLENENNLIYDCHAEHMSANTGILVQTNLIAGKNSISKLSGAAVIAKDCNECTSGIDFLAMCASGARVEFCPAQYISAVPATAGHSAAMYSPSDIQIQYLHESGLGQAEVNETLYDAFRNKFTLF